MRLRVPATALLLCCAAVSARVEAYTSQITLTKMKADADCTGAAASDAPSTAQQWKCKSFGDTVCENVNVQGCSSSQPRLTSSLDQAQSGPDFVAKKNNDYAQAATFASKAQVCCSGTGQCDSGDFRAFQASAGVSAGAQGANGSAANGSVQQTNLMKLNSSAGGGCQAYKDLAIDQYNTMQAASKLAPCNSDNSCQNEVATFGNEVQEKISNVAALNDSIPMQAAQAANGAAGQAGNDAVAMNASVTSRPTASGNTAADGGGMGGIGTALQQALPVMGALAPLMMNQGNNNGSSTTPTTPTSAACGGTVTGGPCGAAMASAATTPGNGVAVVRRPPVRPMS